MSNSRKFHLHDGKTGSALAVRITPRSSRNEIFEIMEDGTVKIRITAPPVEGQANKQLIKFLSEILDVPPTQLEIVAGATGREKIVAIEDMDSSSVHQKIISNLT
jgi:uncharacterized protein (TIGR00251 family)